MTYKSGMKIKVEAEPTLMNPEDALNDMVDDGVSVEDALNFIITESIVESKVNELLKDNDDLFGGEFEILDDGMVEVVIKSWDDV
tara:strand:- start:346 stop:600 length:255 start_codon:yes stop_codon:yes gene_type:complete